MTQIPEDIMDAAEAIHINYVMPDPAEVRLAIAEAILAERNRVLSTLPIAGEGKDGLVPAKAAEFSRMVREYRANSDNDHGARMQEDLEMFLMENLCEIEAALISSPGKDGGQEVEAAEKLQNWLGSAQSRSTCRPDTLKPQNEQKRLSKPRMLFKPKLTVYETRAPSPPVRRWSRGSPRTSSRRNMSFAATPTTPRTMASAR